MKHHERFEKENFTAFPPKPDALFQQLYALIGALFFTLKPNAVPLSGMEMYEYGLF